MITLDFEDENVVQNLRAMRWLKVISPGTYTDEVLQQMYDEQRAKDKLKGGITNETESHQDGNGRKVGPEEEKVDQQRGMAVGEVIFDEKAGALRG